MIRSIALIFSIDNSELDVLCNLLLFIVHFFSCLQKTSSTVEVALSHARTKICAEIIRVFDVTLHKIFHILHLLIIRSLLLRLRSSSSRLLCSFFGSLLLLSLGLNLLLFRASFFAQLFLLSFLDDSVALFLLRLNVRIYLLSASLVTFLHFCCIRRKI